MADVVATKAMATPARNTANPDAEDDIGQRSIPLRHIVDIRGLDAFNRKGIFDSGRQKGVAGDDAAVFKKTIV